MAQNFEPLTPSPRCKNGVKSMRILIVEDDREINKLLSDYLQNEGFETVKTHNGAEAELIMKNEKFDIVLMDLMLPEIPGEKLIAKLRETSDTPVIVVSAKSEIETRLEMLRIGADDYIVKPFNLDEVLVRIQVVLRRMNKDVKRNITRFENHGLVLLKEEKRVEYEGKEIVLTAKELKILELLMTNPNKTFTKAGLYESVWNDEYYYEDNIINVHVSNLRNKLKKITGRDYIETVWGIGYRLNNSQ